MSTRWAPRTQAWIVALAIASSPAGVGCEKQKPPDPELAAGYRLLLSDPTAAYEAFGKARDARDPKVLLGRGLALEGMRKYPEAEQALLAARAVADDPAVWLPLARVELMLGKPDAARKNVDAVVARVPSDLVALLLETCLASDPGRARQALAHLDAWPKAKPATNQRPIPTEYHLARASLLGQLGDAAGQRQAIAAAERASLVGERDALALATLAAKANRRDLAVSVLRQLSAANPSPGVLRQLATLAHLLEAHDIAGHVLARLPSDKNDAALLRLRAEHAVATNQPQAIASLRTALRAAKTREDRAALQLMLSDTLLRQGAFADARKELEVLLREHPGQRAAPLLLARIDLAEGHAKEALERIQPLLVADPPPGADEIAALAQIQAGSPQLALPHLEALLKREPTHPLAARLLVRVRLQAGQTQEALDAVSGLVKQAPQHVGLRLLLAEVSRRAGGSRAATAVLRSAVDALPHAYPLWLALAREHQLANAPEQALAVLEEGRKKNPEELALLAALAGQLSALGQKDRAAPLYAEVVRQSERDVVALNNLAMLEADELGHAERAVELAERAHQMAPSLAAVTDTLGWALFRRGKPADKKRARELLESVRAELTSPTSRFHLGMVLMATGDEAAGRRLIEQSLALPGDFPEAEQARQALGIGR